MVENDYGVTWRPITTRNPQANAIIERVHQTLGNMIRTFSVGDAYLPDQDPWSGILSATMFAICATYHTTTQAMLAQLVFGRETILNTHFIANWKFIRQRKQNLIGKNNKKENMKRIPYDYKEGDLVLRKSAMTGKYSNDPYEGPYEIVSVHDNGTVRLRMGAIVDTVNIRLLHPYYE